MSRGGRPPPGLDSMYSLKVDNLTFRTSPDTLKKEFEHYGDVGDVYIPKDKHSKESRGFAFVRFFDKRDAEDAMDGMDGQMLDGRELRVAMARYARPTEPVRDYGGRRRESYGGGRRLRRSRSRERDRRSYSRSRSREKRYARSRSRSRSYEQRRRRRYSRSRSSSHSSRSSRSSSAERNGND